MAAEADHYCNLEAYTAALNLLLKLNHPREFYFDKADSWFRKWTSITNTRLADQKLLNIEASQVQRFKSNLSRGQQQNWTDQQVLENFGKDLDVRIRFNNELVDCLDYLLETHDFSGRASMSNSFHAFFYDMINTNDVYVSQIDGEYFADLPKLSYNKRTTLTEELVLESLAVSEAGLNCADGVPYTHTDADGKSPERKPFASYTERDAALLFVSIAAYHYG